MPRPILLEPRNQHPWIVHPLRSFAALKIHRNRCSSANPSISEGVRIGGWNRSSSQGHVFGLETILINNDRACVWGVFGLALYPSLLVLRCSRLHQLLKVLSLNPFALPHACSDETIRQFGSKSHFICAPTTRNQRSRPCCRRVCDYQTVLNPHEFIAGIKVSGYTR